MSRKADAPWRPVVHEGLEYCVGDFDGAMALADQLRTFENPELFLLPNRPVVFGALLCADGGWTDGGLEWILANVHHATLTGSGELRLQIEVEDVGRKSVSLPLPPSAELYLRCCMRVAVSSSVAKALHCAGGLSPTRFADGFNRLQSAMGAPRSIALKSFYACIRIRTLDHLPNAIVSLLAIEPGAQHASQLKPLIGSPELIDLQAQNNFRHWLKADSPKTILSAHVGAESQRVPAAWQAEADKALARFFDRLRLIEADRKAKSELRKSENAAARDIALRELSDAGFPNTSSACLAIRWASHRFDSPRNPLSSTVRKYVGVIFHAGLFLDDDAFDLRAWDDEDWADFAQDVLDRAETPDTQNDYESLLADFLRVAARHLEFAMPDIRGSLQARSESIRRARVLRPTEIDAIARALIARGTRHYKRIAVAILLGYYGLPPVYADGLNKAENFCS